MFNEELEESFFYQISEPHILSDDINLDEYDDFIFPIFHDEIFRIYLPDDEAKKVVEKVYYLGGEIVKNNHENATLITTQELLKNMDQKLLIFMKE